MFRQCSKLMKCSVIGETNILRRIVTVSCVIDGYCKYLDGQMRWIMSAVFDVWTAILRDGLMRLTLLCDIRLIDVHVGLWTYAMDFVRDSGCYLPQRGSTHRICAPDLQPHCEPDL